MSVKTYAVSEETADSLGFEIEVAEGEGTVTLIYKSGEDIAENFEVLAEDLPDLICKLQEIEDDLFSHITDKIINGIEEIVDGEVVE